MTAESRTLATLVAEARGLDKAAFTKAHPAPALVVGAIRRPRPASSGNETVRIEVGRVEEFAYRTAPVSESKPGETPRDPLAVFRPDSVVSWLVKNPGDKHPFRFFTVGRAPNNDVVLPHPSVSKVHILINVEPSGAAPATDARTTNGTWLNGERLEGTPRPLKPGDYLRAGDEVHLLYADAAALHALVARMGESGRAGQG